jgi:hypothetical protein
MTVQPTWPFPTDDPYSVYRQWRNRAPVQWIPDLDCFVVLSYDLAAAVLRDDEWSSNPRNSPSYLQRLGDAGSESEILVRSMLFADPPDHARLRTPASRFFSPQRMKEIRVRVASIVEAAFGHLKGESSIDVMEELAYAIPVAVIAELFDIGTEGAEILRTETPILARLLDLDADPEEIRAALVSATALMLYLVPLVAERRKQPGDDLISQLIRSASHDDLRIDDLVGTCLLLLVAGHATTANLIGNGTALLLERPGAAASIGSNAELVRGAVEEVLRFESPVQLTSRVSRGDTRLGGCMIHSGQQVVVVIGSANRDPARFEDPDVFDLNRIGPSHLSFGHGVHFCLGAALARMEAEEYFLRLAPRVADSSFTFGGLKQDSSRTLRRLGALRISVTKKWAEAVVPNC